MLLQEEEEEEEEEEDAENMAKIDIAEISPSGIQFSHEG